MNFNELQGCSYHISWRAFGVTSQIPVDRPRLILKGDIDIMDIRHLLGVKNAVSIFIVVDLPAPFGPKKPTTSPGLYIEN